MMLSLELQNPNAGVEKAIFRELLQVMDMLERKLEDFVDRLLRNSDGTIVAVLRYEPEDAAGRELVPEVADLLRGALREIDAWYTSRSPQGRLFTLRLGAATGHLLDAVPDGQFHMVGPALREARSSLT